jgi:hypothetical protein
MNLQLQIRKKNFGHGGQPDHRNLLEKSNIFLFLKIAPKKAADLKNDVLKYVLLFAEDWCLDFNLHPNS